MISKLVATEVAYGNRDDCFAGLVERSSLGGMLAFFDVVAAFVHALIDLVVATRQCCTERSTALARLPGCGSVTCVTCWPMRAGKRQ